ncbi:MAG TPA: DUF1552 domain-containing protein, partial [Tepidisphaeraceae bacterium]|nr:DUF1552 domain-containing protein [Tepidisphaeraceae bacterium]
DASAAAAATASAARGLATTATGAPLRLAFVYFPNGAIQSTWWPGGEGKNFTLAPTMEPLKTLTNQIQVHAGLDHLNATSGNDGGGDHARASGTFLTGVRVKKTAGADIHAGVSIDQVVAKHVGQLTRFPSLEMTCDAVHKSGACDTGYSCAYQYNVSWQSPETPIAPEPNPRLLFERLFGAGAHGQRRAALKARQAQQKSLLDFVMEDAHELDSQLGGRDRQKLDEYLTSVRDVEKRIQASERFGQTPDPSVDTPAGVPASYVEYVQVMYDLLLLAFQTDSTRVGTFLVANEGSNRSFTEIGIPEGHHYLSHHMGAKEKMDKVAQIDRFYMDQFARFLKKADATKDVDGNSILHNSMIVYGSGNSDGNRHTHVNLPVVLAGAGGGRLTPGHYSKNNSKPMCNLFLSLADRMGVPTLPRFGDSTDRLTSI